jgi:sporulation-control protein spo0M
MKKKVKVSIVIGVVLIIAISGKAYIDLQNEKHEVRVEEQKIEAERISVIALKNTFADIRSVEFEMTAYNTMTGSYRMFVKMTNQKNESVNFSFSFSKKSPGEIGAYVVEDEEIQVEGVTTNKVQVIFSNKVEGEV